MYESDTPAPTNENWLREVYSVALWSLETLTKLKSEQDHIIHVFGLEG